MKKILITGAAGFIGFHVSKRFLDMGYEVIGIDNVNDYYTQRLKYARLRELGIRENEVSARLSESDRYDRFRFAKVDVADLSALSYLFGSEGFDIVVHLAAQAGVRYSIENPHAYIQSNVVGFTNILECAREARVEHLVYASSSSVYGDAHTVPFVEDECVDYPVSVYAATKKSNELLAHVYSHLYHLPTSGLRFFTVYGPWGRPDMSPMLFAKAIRDGHEIKVFNHGDMMRDFTYIDDIVEGVCRIAMVAPDARSVHPYYDVYNIGNSKPVRLMDFIQILENAMGHPVQKKFLPMQPGDVYQTYADTTKLLKRVGYQPRYTLSEGISVFAEWFNNQSII